MCLRARIDALEEERQVLSKHVTEDEKARKKLLVVTQQATAMLETLFRDLWKLLL